MDKVANYNYKLAACVIRASQQTNIMLLNLRAELETIRFNDSSACDVNKILCWNFLVIRHTIGYTYVSMLRSVTYRPYSYFIYLCQTTNVTIRPAFEFVTSCPQRTQKCAALKKSHNRKHYVGKYTVLWYTNTFLLYLWTLIGQSL